MQTISRYLISLGSKNAIHKLATHKYLTTTTSEPNSPPWTRQAKEKKLKQQTKRIMGRTRERENKQKWKGKQEVMQHKSNPIARNAPQYD